MKICTKCNHEKSLTEFSKVKKNKDGLNYICKDCNKLKMKEWHKNNKEKSVQSGKKWREKNREHYNKYNKKWREENTDIVSDYQRQWRNNNKELKSYHSRKRRELKKFLNEDFTFNDECYIRDLYQHKCFNCNDTEKLSLDHTKPLSKGFAMTINNCTLLCNSCNSSKHTKMPEHFYSKEQLEELEIIYNQIVY